MSFLLRCCFHVELDEDTPVIKKSKGELNGRKVKVQQNAPLPIPKTITVKVQPEHPSSYQSFRNNPNFLYISTSDEGSSEDTAP